MISRLFAPVIALLSIPALAGEFTLTKAPLRIYTGPRSNPTSVTTIPPRTTIMVSRQIGGGVSVRAIADTPVSGSTTAAELYAAMDARSLDGARLAPGDFLAASVALTAEPAGVSCGSDYGAGSNQCTARFLVNVALKDAVNAEGMVSCTAALQFAERGSSFPRMESNTGHQYVIVTGGAGRTTVEVRVDKPQLSGEIDSARYADGACRMETLDLKS